MLPRNGKGDATTHHATRSEPRGIPASSQRWTGEGQHGSPGTRQIVFFHVSRVRGVPRSPGCRYTSGRVGEPGCGGDSCALGDHYAHV